MLWREYYRQVERLQMIALIVNQGGMRSKAFTPQLPPKPFKDDMTEEEQIDDWDSIVNKLGGTVGRQR